MAQDYREDRELPEGPLGERIRELIDVINSDDGERIRAYIETAWSSEFRDTAPIEQHLQVFAEAYRNSRGFDFYGVRGGPAGGGFSTVEDLLRFDRALRSHNLLSPEGTESVLSGRLELESPRYGFGFRISGGHRERIAGHSGGFAGISSNLDMFLDSGYTAIVMSDYDGGAIPIQQKMRKLIAAAGSDPSR